MNKNGSVNVQSTVVWSRLTADQEVSIRNQSSEVSVNELNFFSLGLGFFCLSPKF